MLFLRDIGYVSMTYPPVNAGHLCGAPSPAPGAPASSPVRRRTRQGFPRANNAVAGYGNKDGVRVIRPPRRAAWRVGGASASSYCFARFVWGNVPGPPTPFPETVFRTAGTEIKFPCASRQNTRPTAETPAPSAHSVHRLSASASALFQRCDHAVLPVKPDVAHRRMIDGSSLS